MNNKVVAIIPARSGSKGFTDKNISKIDGKTLIEIAIQQAQTCADISEVYISTDSFIYETIAKEKGAVSLGLRSSELANDTAKTIDVVKDLIKHKDFNDVTHIVLLQPTSPLRKSKDITDAIKMSILENESVVSVAKIEDPHPYKMKKIVSGRVVPFIDGFSSEIPRQKYEEVYELTGSIYVTPIKTINEESSFFSKGTLPLYQEDFINIDKEDDYRYLKYLIESKIKRIF